VKVQSTRHWSDWIGAAVFLAIGVNLWQQSAEFGILILPSLLQELLVTISFLVRPKARRVAPSWQSRAVAYAHTFGVMAFLLYATAQRPDWIRPTTIPELRTAGAVLWLCGAVLSLWPLWYLRRSFSVEPEARSLVTAGPYRWARHPIYAVYLWINLGILLRHLTASLAVVLIVWTALLLRRIRYEEAVLAEAFPDYRDYQRRVGALWPKLKPRMLR
jgi:protein-S-isoprenylcysteine O-methyltransferase Ste14